VNGQAAVRGCGGSVVRHSAVRIGDKRSFQATKAKRHGGRGAQLRSATQVTSNRVNMPSLMKSRQKVAAAVHQVCYLEEAIHVSLGRWCALLFPLTGPLACLHLLRRPCLTNSGSSIRRCGRSPHTWCSRWSDMPRRRSTRCSGAPMPDPLGCPSETWGVAGSASANAVFVPWAS
jgi:hypothetical protein